MFSAAISVFAAAAAHKSLQILKANPSIVQQLHQNCRLFRSKFESIVWPEDVPKKMRFHLGGIPDQPIFPVIF